MQQVSETIPEELVPRVEAAVAWFNSSPESAGETFRATGILDADDALQGSDKLQLILCGGNRCEQHSFLVKNLAEKWSIDFFGNDTSQRGEQAQAVDRRRRLRRELESEGAAGTMTHEHILLLHGGGRATVLVHHRSQVL